jgi:hypothetical protein
MAGCGFLNECDPPQQGKPGMETDCQPPWTGFLRFETGPSLTMLHP